jgi:C4-dicarboxylate-specific signal transduction histidine kinase
VQQARRAADVVARLRRLVQAPRRRRRALQPLALQAPCAGADLLQPELRRRRGGAPADDAPGLQVQADPVALEQIVHNLVTQRPAGAGTQVPAAAPPGVAAAVPDQARVLLRVRDSGPGFAPEPWPRVFEPFFTTRDGGLGLGLSLCETLATGMGGALQARHATPRGGGRRTGADAAAGEACRGHPQPPP